MQYANCWHASQRTGLDLFKFWFNNTNLYFVKVIPATLNRMLGNHRIDAPAIDVHTVGYAIQAHKNEIDGRRKGFLLAQEDLKAMQRFVADATAEPLNWCIAHEDSCHWVLYVCHYKLCATCIITNWNMQEICNEPGSRTVTVYDSLNNCKYVDIIWWVDYYHIYYVLCAIIFSDMLKRYTRHEYKAIKTRVAQQVTANQHSLIDRFKFSSIGTQQWRRCWQRLWCARHYKCGAPFARHPTAARTHQKGEHNHCLLTS